MTTLMKIIGITLLLNIVIFLVGISYSNASDHNSLLKGEYVVSRHMTCAEGPFGVVGFNPDLSRSVDGWTTTMHAQSIYTFNGDGTGSWTTAVVGIKNNNLAGQYPVGDVYASGTLIYNVNDDRSFIVEAQITSSNRGLVSGIVYEGWIGHGNQLLIISDTQPNIEIVTNQTGDTRQRICARNMTAMRKK
jgi:hypothetical protein